MENEDEDNDMGQWIVKKRWSLEVMRDADWSQLDTRRRKESR